jgi:hypothetical protein
MSLKACGCITSPPLLADHGGHNGRPQGVVLGARLGVGLCTARSALQVEVGQQPEGVGQAGVLQGPLDQDQDRGKALHVGTCLGHDLLRVERERAQRKGNIALLDGHWCVLSWG